MEWRPTAKMNVDILNDTGDFYRYFDATPQVEFLFECLMRTIEHDLPQEAALLERYHAFKSRIETIADMPASKINLLFNFLKQNDGVLSKRVQAKEFDALTVAETAYVEATCQELFSCKKGDAAD